MQNPNRFVLLLFCGLYAFSLLGVGHYYVNIIYDGGDSMQKQVLVPGLSSANFDQCKLVSRPVWTEYLKEKLDPDFDPMKTCNRSFSPWTELRPDGRVFINMHGPKEATCRARAVLFKSEYKTKNGEWHEINEEFVFENDIVEVECKVNEVTAYNFLHTQVWRQKSDTEHSDTHRLSRLASKPPSVHIIILDSIGSSHGRRIFNRTHRFLREEFGAVEMLHMTKVGENSRPNAISLTFGKVIGQIQRDMYREPSIPADWTYKEHCKTYLDDKGFILKQFEKSGYITMWAEDYRNACVFNFPGCNGFRNPQTTHYMRPFQVRLDGGGKTMKGNMGKGNCFESHLFLNDYHEKFIKAYPDLPKASLTWAVYLGHDSPYQPFHADIQYEQFFERNKEEFDNSFVFFLADHGMRFGWYAEDPVGQRDINNPMLMISVPRNLRQNADLTANLERNSNQLLTHLDTHATFVDILETFSRNDSPDFSETTRNPTLNGSSLLRPLPLGPRNCKTLPIPPQYCICETVKYRLNVTDQYVAIGKAVPTYLNVRLAENKIDKICAALDLDELMELHRIDGANELYEVTVKLKPGGGIFRTFVMRTGDQYSVIVPDVPRLNKYGTVGHCTSINELRPICFCKSNLPKASTPKAG
ncbi:hypothetical protein PENTCL1PPCAC_15060 [Pristionchus entomophagus]|uniref:Uncharacterized protein n=1 Tax=Pristionchus entomophagus TaxID=358040 RepID=A0AAV5TBF0_9BILA|nr:hypothetical protein PENTCL1PPCAC_15060 [Pristionchus entomophagus]